MNNCFSTPFILIKTGNGMQETPADLSNRSHTFHEHLLIISDDFFYWDNVPGLSNVLITQFWNYATQRDWLMLSYNISIFCACMCVLPCSEKDSLGRLQHVWGIDIDALSIIESGLVAHHHHPTFQRSQGWQAATRDCGGRRWYVYTDTNYRHSSLLCGWTLSTFRRRRRRSSLTGFTGHQHGWTQAILQELGGTLNHVKQPSMYFLSYCNVHFTVSL